MIRILLVDDHEMVREGLKRILSEFPDIEVVAEAASGEQALDRTRTARADVTLLDVSMPGGGSKILDLVRGLRSSAPHSQVLILSMHTEGPLAVQALRAGAAGYVRKTSSPTELVAAIRRVAEGRRYLTRGVAEALADAVAPQPRTKPREQLSEREFEVLCMLGAGKAIKEIARDLDLSAKTVSTYRSRLAEKLGLETTADLIRYAIEHDLSSLE